MSRSSYALARRSKKSEVMISEEDAISFEADNEPRISDYWNILADSKWMILGIILGTVLLAGLYGLFSTPVYRANLLVQVEDAAPDSKSFLNETTGLFDVKTSAAGELQVITSRMVLSAAAEQAGLEVSAHPKYLPFIGKWLARKSEKFSTPGFLGFDGYVAGNEKIELNKLIVPSSFEDVAPFVLTLGDNGSFKIRHEFLNEPLEGNVDQPLKASTSAGDIEIEIKEISGKSGAEYLISKASELKVVENLQGRLQVSEQGRQSNVINVALEDSDRERLILTLNAIAEQYIKQNAQRKSAEAEKTLAFLDTQLPLFKSQLKDSEDAYAQFRNQNGTIAFEEEARVLLKRTSDLQASLLELQQRSKEADSNFTDQSPRQQTLSRQKAAVQNELNTVNARISAMPNMQRDSIRLERAVTVNSALYQSMMNNASQMRLVKEGKVGNVRLLDKAVMSKEPVKPQKGLLLALALVLGIIVGPGAAIIRSKLQTGLRDPRDLSFKTGIEIYAVVPQSPQQQLLEQNIAKGHADKFLLADAYPNSQPVEALRNLRAVLKANSSKVKNNRILITGATPGIGKSFIAGNFARLLSQSGKHVLLINADLRKKDKNAMIGLKKTVGLAEILLGKTIYEDAINYSVKPNLDVISTGQLPMFPTELLESETFEKMLELLSSRYDYIVVDTAPVLVAADVLAIAPLCGTVLFVAKADKSHFREVDECVRRLAQADVFVDGILFNGMDLNRKANGSNGIYRYSEYQYSNKADIA